MARPLWTGYVSFGLVAIPASIVAAEQKNELHFHLLDSRDKSRVRYQRLNSETGKEVPWDKIVKAYEYDKNSYIILNDEDFKKASPEAFKSIEIEEFVDLEEIDPLYFEKPYYLIPASKNKKAYVLLREALKKTYKVGVAKVVIRTKEYLSLIMPHHDALVIHLIHFKEDLVTEEELELPRNNLKSYKIADKEINIAIELIQGMSSSWNPDKYHNEYRESLMKWIKKKIKVHGKDIGKNIPEPSHEKLDEVVDFVALLKQSLKKKKRA